MRQKINILFTIPNFKTAGSQYVMLSIIRGLEPSKFNLFIAVKDFPEFIPTDIAKDRRLVLSFSTSTYKNVRQLSKILNNNNIDILHSWDYKSDLTEVIACRLIGVKYLFTKKNNSWSKRWKLKSLLANYIAYDNPSMKDRFFNNTMLKSKTTFIPHGVNLNTFCFRPSQKNRNFNICSIGNVVENKNQGQIIEALKYLSKDVHLQIYGNEDKTYRAYLEKLITDYNLQERVHFHGFINNEEIPQILIKQDVFVLASRQEGLPVCLLEALACGLPVLSSDSGGGARYILEDNQGGYIYSSTKDMVEHIKCIQNDEVLYKDLSKSAVKNVSARFSLQNEITAYKNLYLKLYS
jgi:glycosyltransferase involved in cell wall biosynthesis